jgi:hypothetical protein
MTYSCSSPQIEKLVAANKNEILKKRYKFNTGMIMGKVLCIMMAFIVGRKGDKICNDFNDVL